MSDSSGKYTHKTLSSELNIEKFLPLPTPVLFSMQKSDASVQDVKISDIYSDTFVARYLLFFAMDKSSAETILFLLAVNKLLTQEASVPKLIEKFKTIYSLFLSREVNSAVEYQLNLKPDIIASYSAELFKEQAGESPAFCIDALIKELKRIKGAMEEVVTTSMIAEFKISCLFKLYKLNKLYSTAPATMHTSAPHLEPFFTAMEEAYREVMFDVLQDITMDIRDLLPTDYLSRDTDPADGGSKLPYHRRTFVTSEEAKVKNTELQHEIQFAWFHHDSAVGLADSIVKQISGANKNWYLKFLVHIINISLVCRTPPEEGPLPPKNKVATLAL